MTSYYAEPPTVSGRIAGHISAFEHVIQYFGNYLQARVWPGCIAVPHFGDSVSVKPFYTEGFNLITTGYSHEGANIYLAGSAGTPNTGYGNGSDSEIGFFTVDKSGNWRNGLVPNALWGDPVSVVYPLAYSATVWFLNAFTADFINSDSLSSGALFRSLDSGKTWTLVTRWDANYPFFHLARDINGNLWSVSYHNDNVTNNVTTVILKSTDLGDTWTQAYTYTGLDATPYSPQPTHLSCIACSPTNANNIVALGVNVGTNNKAVLVTSTDGSTFTRYEQAVTTRNGGGYNTSIAAFWRKSGRLFFIPGSSNDGTTLFIMYTDDYTNLTTVASDPAHFRQQTGGQYAVERILSLTGDIDDDRLFVHFWYGSRGFSGPGPPWPQDLFISYDKGLTWKYWGSPPDTSNFVSDPSQHQDESSSVAFNGISYDETEDALYLFYACNSDFLGGGRPRLPSQTNFTDTVVPAMSTPTNQFQVLKLCPTIENGIWVDVTNDLNPALGNGHQVASQYTGLFIHLMPY